MPGASRERMLELAKKSEENRKVRAEIKRKLQNQGEHFTIRDALVHPLCQATLVHRFLTWPRGWNDHTVEVIMAKLEIAPGATVGELSAYQKARIGEGIKWLDPNDLKTGYCRGCGAKLRLRGPKLCVFCAEEKARGER